MFGRNLRTKTSTINPEVSSMHHRRLLSFPRLAVSILLLGLRVLLNTRLSRETIPVVNHALSHEGRLLVNQSSVTGTASSVAGKLRLRRQDRHR